MGSEEENFQEEIFWKINKIFKIIFLIFQIWENSKGMTLYMLNKDCKKNLEKDNYKIIENKQKK